MDIKYSSDSIIETAGSNCTNVPFVENTCPKTMFYHLFSDEMKSTNRPFSLELKFIKFNVFYFEWMWDNISLYTVAALQH